MICVNNADDIMLDEKTIYNYIDAGLLSVGNVGALFYGVIMGTPFVYKDGAFHPEGILWILGMAASWGIFFYLIFTKVMKIAEKRADKNVEEKEKAIEE